MRADLDSRGEVLWREFWRLLTTEGAPPWLRPFDPAAPLTTPSDLDPAAPSIGRSLASAVEDLRTKGLALDVTVGEVQREPRGSRSIPIHGCGGGEGCANVITTTRDDAGRYDPYTGSSFIMVAGFDRRGRPHGQAILTYSQSENPRSRHYSDQTRLYARKRWLPMRFTERQIRRDAAYRRIVVKGRR